MKIDFLFEKKKMSLKLTENWGGLIETLETCEQNNNLPDSIKILKQKLKVLEESKNLKEIQHALHFTIEERNYLNSPLLDEIFDTIFNKNPLEEALQNEKQHAAIFYSKRGLEISQWFFRYFIYDRDSLYHVTHEEIMKRAKYLQSIGINISKKEFRKIINELMR